MFQKTRYTLKTADGVDVLNEDGKIGKFYSTDLQKVDINTVPINVETDLLNEIVDEDGQVIEPIVVNLEKPPTKKPMKNDTTVDNIVEGKRTRTKKVFEDHDMSIEVEKAPKKKTKK